MSLQNLSEWKNNFPNKDNVQPNEHKGTTDGAYLSGESVVIVSGPSVLSGGRASELFPVGLVQSAQLQQNKQLNEIFEIGGRTPFFIPSRTRVRASLSRVLFDGPSLFYALYQRSSGELGAPAQNTVPPTTTFGSGSTNTLNNPTAPYPDNGTIGEGVDGQDTPGAFWGNLGSAIFNKPLGLGFILYDMEGGGYGGVYLERCFIQSHQFGISANATVLAENVTLAASRVRPLASNNIV